MKKDEIKVDYIMLYTSAEENISTEGGGFEKWTY